MPNPTKAIEALPAVAEKIADTVAERLLGETLVHAPKAGAELAETAAIRAGGLRTMLSPLTAYLDPSDPASVAMYEKGVKLLAEKRSGTLTLAVPKEVGEKLAANATDRFMKGNSSVAHTKSGFTYVEGDMKLVTGSSNLTQGRARQIEEKLTARGIDVDRVEALKKFAVEIKPGTGGVNAGPGSDFLHTKEMNIDGKYVQLGALKLGTPKEALAPKEAVVPKEPVMPTKAFEIAGERKTVSKLADGSTLTEYTTAPLPFRFSDPARSSRSVAYGDAAYTVKQLPDGSVTIGNPEGISRIGQGFEKAHNTLGLQTTRLELSFMPKWFQAKNEHLSQSGVPAWYKGDRSWLYGQVNGTKGARPVEASFSESSLAQIRYENPVKVGFGPFEGLSGDVMGFAKNGDALLVNTNKIVGAKPETFVYRKGSSDIETWRLIPNAAGENEVKRVLMTPRAFLNLVER